jgi:hypothetical protein
MESLGGWVLALIGVLIGLLIGLGAAASIGIVGCSLLSLGFQEIREAEAHKPAGPMEWLFPLRGRWLRYAVAALHILVGLGVLAPLAIVVIGIFFALIGGIRMLLAG